MIGWGCLLCICVICAGWFMRGDVGIMLILVMACDICNVLYFKLVCNNMGFHIVGWVEHNRL